MTPEDQAFAEWAAECQNPWPKAQPGWELGLREVCGYRKGDVIHDSWEACEEETGHCLNHDAHHAFVPPA